MEVTPTVPRELIEWIFSFLDGKDICRGRMVCKLWDEAVRMASPSLWHRVLEDSLGARDKPHHIKKYRGMSLCQYFSEVMQHYRSLMISNKYEEVVRFASSHGHLQILKMLESKHKGKFPWKVWDGYDSKSGRYDQELTPVALAVEGGHVHVLLWLRSTQVGISLFRGIRSRWPSIRHFAASLGNREMNLALTQTASGYDWGCIAPGPSSRWRGWHTFSQIIHPLRPSWIAARFGHTDCIVPDSTQLSSFIAEVNQKGYIGFNILHQALLGGHIQTFEWLLSRGINFKDSTDPTFLAVGVLSERIHVVEYLLNKGYRPQSNGYELHLAANAGCLTILKLLLKHIPPSEKALEWLDGDGRTPLMAALMKGRMHKPTIEYLIDEGSNINATDNQGRSVLWYLWRCPFKNSDESMPPLQRKLLDGGVDLQWNYEGRGCLTNLFRGLNRFPLIAEQLSNMLIEGGVPLDDPELIPVASSYRWTLKSFQDFLVTLTKSNKDLFLKDPPDLIRRCAANGVRAGRLQEIIKRLRELGVTDNLFIVSPSNGETPFSCCKTESDESIRELVAAGGDINLRNGKGQHSFVSHLLSWLPNSGSRRYRSLLSAYRIIASKVKLYASLGARLTPDDVAACASMIETLEFSGVSREGAKERLTLEIQKLSLF